MILVTGATGQIGSVLVRELCRDNEKVRILARKNSNLCPLQDLPLEIIVGDILDQNSLLRAMKGVDCVFHLAGLIPTRPGAGKMMAKVNAEGTRNLCEVALKCKLKKLIYISTVHIFSQIEKDELIDETNPLVTNGCSSSYQASKVAATLAVLALTDQGIHTVVLCPSGVIGVSNNLVPADDMVRALLSFASGKVNLIVKGAFDFVDVRDVVKAITAAHENGESGQFYIISGTRAKIDELRHITQQVAGVSAPRLIVPNWLAYFGVTILQLLQIFSPVKSGYNTYTLQTLQGNTFYSSEKARQELGYRPRPLETSIYDCLFLNNKLGQTDI